MDTSGQLNLTEAVPPDLLPLIRRSGILSDRQFGEISGKVRSGEYPAETRVLAERLIGDGILTVFQADRLLRNKTHGLIMGPYVILDRLGTGTRGRVFKAQHRLMGRLVAVKVIAPEIASRASSIARFHREMRLSGRLDHPNVVRAFDADKVGDVLYIVVEYVAGRSLDLVIEERGRLPAAEVVNYMAQAALGLAHAHERGIVHRDIKPANLLLSEEGQIKVLDLGLSALMEADGASFATVDGSIVGTVNYMSPEQATAQTSDGRSDLFSLGCTMYKMLSGQLPFAGATVAECIALRVNGQPTPITDFLPDLSPHLTHVLMKLLARLPEDRFQTAAEAALALQALAHEETGSLSTVQPTPQPAPDPSVPQPAASTDLFSALGPSTSLVDHPLVTAESTRFDFVRFVAAHLPLIAFLIIVLELAVFGLGFALGHAWARPPG